MCVKNKKLTRYTSVHIRIKTVKTQHSCALRVCQAVRSAFIMRCSFAVKHWLILDSAKSNSSVTFALGQQCPFALCDSGVARLFRNLNKQELKTTVLSLLLFSVFERFHRFLWNRPATPRNALSHRITAVYIVSFNDGHLWGKKKRLCLPHEQAQPQIRNGM